MPDPNAIVDPKIVFQDAVLVLQTPDNKTGEVDHTAAYNAFVRAAELGAGPRASFNAAWTAEGDQVGANFGDSVATAGDVNGDGYSDVLVGAHDYSNGEFREGRAFLYLGSATGLAAAPARRKSSFATLTTTYAVRAKGYSFGYSKRLTDSAYVL